MSKNITPSERFGIAVKLAPHYASRFDYSGGEFDRPDAPSHYALMADMAFKAADALIAKYEADIAAAAKEAAEATKKEGPSNG